MKKLVFAFMLMFSASLFASNLSTSPDWLIYHAADGTIEVYNDGCDGSLTIVNSDGLVINIGDGPC